jgi:carbamoyl-phosphate synthase large subunit
MKKNQQKKNILVTAAGGSAGFSALRFLTEFPQVRLFATDTDGNSQGQYFAREFKIMAPFYQREAYARDLRRLISHWDIDLVIPTLDEEMEEISRVLADTGVQILASPPTTLQLVMNKEKFSTWAWEHMREFTALTTTLDREPSWDAGEYFVKPIHGRGGDGCLTLPKEELAGLRRDLAASASAYLLMEVLPGREWTVDAYVTKAGVVRYIVPRERLVVESGVSKKGRTEKNSLLMAATEMLIAKVPFYGPICVQYKEDARGQPKLLEVNARMSGGSSITKLAGANPMRCLIEELAGKAPHPVPWREIIGVGYTTYKTV